MKIKMCDVAKAIKGDEATFMDIAFKADRYFTVIEPCTCEPKCYVPTQVEMTAFQDRLRDAIKPKAKVAKPSELAKTLAASAWAKPTTSSI